MSGLGDRREKDPGGKKKNEKNAKKKCQIRREETAGQSEICLLPSDLDLVIPMLPGCPLTVRQSESGGWR